MIPKFRGLSVEAFNEEEWKYGYLIEDEGYSFIINKVIEANEQYITIGSWCPVNPETLGQTTGLFDKNGKEIFEGDIVQFEDCYTETDFLYVNTGIVEWSQGSFTITNRYSVEMGDLLDGEFLDVTLIGNVYENPELLEDKE